MPRYTMSAYTAVYDGETTRKNINLALSDPFVVDKSIETKSKTIFDVQLTIEAADLYAALRGTGTLLRKHGLGVGFRGWSGWYSSDVLRCAQRRLAANYTLAEIANPDSVLQTPIPTSHAIAEPITVGEQTFDGIGVSEFTASDTQAFIKNLRKRHRSLVRYKLAMQFAEAIPGMRFESPRGGPEGGGISVLRTPEGVGITFSSIRNQMHVKGGAAGVDEWMSAGDSHRLQSLLSHNSQVTEQNAEAVRMGNPSILHDIEAQPHVPTPEEIAAQQAWEAWRQERDAAMAAWITEHPEPDVPEWDIPF